MIHRQTVSFYHSSSVCLDPRDTSSWDRNLAEFLYSDILPQCYR